MGLTRITGNQVNGNNKTNVTDLDLTSIASLEDSSIGFLKKTAKNTWVLSSNTTELTGDIIGSGSGTIVTTLANSGVTSGTYSGSITVNAKGIVTNAAQLTNTDIYTPLIGYGSVLQTICTSIPGMSGTSVITLSNSLPTITSGSQIWSTSITPKFYTSGIKLSGSFIYVSGTNTRTLVVCVFRNSTCIGTTTCFAPSSNQAMQISLNFEDNPATISSTTYSIRVGANTSSTWYINRYSPPYFSNSLESSIIALQELS